MNIPKTAVRLSKFKNLMAYTLAIGAVVSPGVLMYAIQTNLPSETLPLSLIRLLEVLSFMIGGVGQIALPIFTIAAGWKSARLPVSPLFWQKYLNKPLSFLQKKENEKLYLSMRELGDLSPKSISEPQFKFLAQTHVDRQMNLPYLAKWLQDAHKSTPNLELEIKNSLISEKMRFFLNKPGFKEIITPYINRYVAQKSQEPHVSLEIGKLVKYADHGRNRNYTMTGVQENYIEFLLGNNYQLKNTDYKEIEKLLKREKEGPLCQMFERLVRYPKSTDWSRIQTAMNNYKNEDYFYRQYARGIKELAQTQSQANAQKGIVAAVKENIDSSVDIKLPSSYKEKSNQSNEKPVEQSTVESERQLERYMSFQPTHFADKWNKIKKSYATIQAHREDYSTLELIPFFTSLNGTLNVLIASDSAISKLPEDFQERARTLLSENLDLAWLQVDQLEKQVGERHIKALEVHKNYQTQKMR